MLSHFFWKIHMLTLLVSFASGLGVTICGWWENAGFSATAPLQTLPSHSKTTPSHLYLLRLSLSKSRLRFVKTFCLKVTILQKSFIYDISFLLLRRTPSWFVKLAFQWFLPDVTRSCDVKNRNTFKLFLLVFIPCKCGVIKPLFRQDDANYDAADDIPYYWCHMSQHVTMEKLIRSIHKRICFWTLKWHWLIYVVLYIRRYICVFV